MAKTPPKVNEPVFLEGKGFTRYFVMKVDRKAKTADLCNTSGSLVHFRDIPWSKLRELDASQNTLRVIEAATEGK